MSYMIGAAERGLLKRYARPIVHMRSQIASKRFGLVLGAGVSKPLGFPDWRELVDRIAGDPEVDGKHLLINVADRLSETSKTQMLYQHFKSKFTESAGEPYSFRLERKIQGEWRRAIQRALYKDTRPCDHPFLGRYLDIIKTSAITVNYNFDDTVEQLLSQGEPEHKTYGRKFETVWNASLPFRADVSVIYHPNGFVPHNILENPSETLVFSEDTFADQLIHSMAGHHASLLHHFSKSSCLFIGLSLRDSTLCHLLRQNALINPGHYHYYVQHVEGPLSGSDESYLRSLEEANFEVYNLVTLFLTSDEIAALGVLLSTDEDVLLQESEEVSTPLAYFYYLTGAVGAGKTTCLSYFGSMRTYEEWTEPRNALLAKSWKLLTEKERSSLDEWIARQFNLKNFRLRQQRSGIHVIDRSPLDPLSFTEEKLIPEKVQFIKRAVSPGDSCRTIQSGHVIFLTGDPDEMEARVVGRNKESKAELIRDMQQKLSKIFRDASVVNTTGSTVYDVIKRVARIVLLEPYRPADLSALLDSFGTLPSSPEAASTLA
jgi:hypothetical protein